MIYMDNAAAERPLETAKNAMNMVLSSCWANPNSSHDFGRSADQIIDFSKKQIAFCLNCDPDEVYFTSSACEAANWATRSMELECSYPLFHEYEHSCVISAARSMHGDSFCKKVAIYQMLANNETGEIYKVSRALAPTKGSLLFVDATAAVGHIPVDFKALGCDYLCGDAMKFGGVPGAAFLIIRKGAPIATVNYGTPHTALIAAMAEALVEKNSSMKYSVRSVSEMRDYLIMELFKIVGAHLNTPWVPKKALCSLPGIVNVSFYGVNANALELRLSKKGIMVSTGAACTSGDPKPSHVLRAIGASDEVAKGAIRISLNEYNTMRECDTVVKEIKTAVEALRKI